MSLREPLVSGEFLAHLARIFLEAFACSSYLLCTLQQFLFNQIVHINYLIFIIKGIFLNLFITHDG